LPLWKFHCYGETLDLADLLVAEGNVELIEVSAEMLKSDTL